MHTHTLAQGGQNGGGYRSRRSASRAELVTDKSVAEEIVVGLDFSLHVATVIITLQPISLSPYCISIFLLPGSSFKSENKVKHCCRLVY